MFFAGTGVNIDLTGEAQTQGLSSSNLPDFGSFIVLILGAIMAIAALLVLINLIVGAFDWISSNGEKGKVETARNKITSSIIGLIILASIVAVFNLLLGFLGLDLGLHKVQPQNGGGQLQAA